METHCRKTDKTSWLTEKRMWSAPEENRLWAPLIKTFFNQMERVSMKIDIIQLGGYTMAVKSIIDRINLIRNSHQRTIRRTKAANLAIGATLGMAVGVAAGVLFAPRTGKETRDDISGRTGEAFNSLKTNVADARNRVVTTIRSKSEQLHKAEETCAEAAREAVGESIEDESSDKGQKHAKKQL